MKRAHRLALVADRHAPAPLSAIPEIRGYAVSYRRGETNHCPGCGKSNWLIRVQAECAFCGTALAIVPGAIQ